MAVRDRPAARRVARLQPPVGGFAAAIVVCARRWLSRPLAAAR